MASITLKVPDRLPAGATVDNYPATNWPPFLQPPSGAPAGSTEGTGDTVAADGTVTVTGLTEGRAYYAHASVSGQDRYVGFTVPVSATTGGTVIQDEGTPLTTRSALDFQGAGVTATDDSTNSKTVVTITGAAAADASATAKGVTKLSTAPVSSTNPIAVGDNDSRNTDTRTPTDGSVTNAKVSGSAAIARSKLDFGSGLVNADVAAAAAIAYSKLNLASSVVSGDIVDATIVAGDLADLAVSARKLTDLARTGGWLPTGAIAQTIGRASGTTTQTITSGTLYLTGGAVLPGGRAVTSITFVSGGTALVSGSNQWFCLVDTSRNVLATTVDDTNTAWAANTVKTLNIASALGGGTPGTYTPANGIEVYLGICVVAGTQPTLKAAAINAGLGGLAPIQSGSSTASLTTPGSLGSTAGALTALATLPYAYVS